MKTYSNKKVLEPVSVVLWIIVNLIGILYKRPLGRKLGILEMLCLDAVKER